MADRGVLSGLPEELRRRERRRRRRPDRTSGSAGLSAAARSRRLVAQPVLHVARRGRRVRRRRTRPTSTRYTARLPTSTRWLPPRTRVASESRSTSSPTISPTSTPGSKKRSPPRLGAASGRDSSSATGKVREASSLRTTGRQCSADRPGLASRTVSGTCTCSRLSNPISTGPTPRWPPSSSAFCASGSTAEPTVSASTWRTAWPRPPACPTLPRAPGQDQ